MFKLQTEYYCEGRPDFEADATTYRSTNGCMTYINCESRERCHNIATRIERKIKEKEMRDNAGTDI